MQIIKRTRCKRIVLAIRLLLGMLVICPAAGAQTRIMPLGNSITEGTGSANGQYNGYRKPLWQSLIGTYNIDLVGTLNIGDGSFDMDHEGHAGWNAAQIKNSITTFLQQTRPHLIIFHIGTNDISSGRSTAAIINDIDATLDRIWRFDAGSRVFLCTLVPRLDGLDDKTQDLNAAIQTLAASRASNGDRIELVDVYGLITSGANWETALMTDNLHPNDNGYALMANALQTSITPYLDLAVPVELVAFSAQRLADSVALEWQTASETNNLGFQIERSHDGRAFATIGFVGGHGTTTTPQRYHFVDRELFAGEFRYRLRQIDTDGTFEFSSLVTVQLADLPFAFALQQNYPNPFNAGTQITLVLRREAAVRLSIHEINGRELVTLVEGNLESGEHRLQWEGRNANGEAVASGIYLYRLEAAGVYVTKQMTVIR